MFSFIKKLQKALCVVFCGKEIWFSTSFYARGAFSAKVHLGALPPNKDTDPVFGSWAQPRTGSSSAQRCTGAPPSWPVCALSNDFFFKLCVLGFQAPSEMTNFKGPRLLLSPWERGPNCCDSQFFLLVVGGPSSVVSLCIYPLLYPPRPWYRTLRTQPRIRPFEATEPALRNSEGRTCTLILMRNPGGSTHGQQKACARRPCFNSTILTQDTVRR